MQGGSGDFKGEDFIPNPPNPAPAVTLLPMPSRRVFRELEVPIFEMLVRTLALDSEVKCGI